MFRAICGINLAAFLILTPAQPSIHKTVPITPLLLLCNLLPAAVKRKGGGTGVSGLGFNQRQDLHQKLGGLNTSLGGKRTEPVHNDSPFFTGRPLTKPPSSAYVHNDTSTLGLLGGLHCVKAVNTQHLLQYGTLFVM